MLLAEDIVNCGYTTQIKMDYKAQMICAIILHSTTRLIPMLQQLRKGLELCGLVNQMNVNAEACRPLFVPGKITKPDADFIMMNCQPQYSEKGTSKERAEKKIINFLQDFLEELEISGTILDNKRRRQVKGQHVLQWMTGQAHTPILPSEKQHFRIKFSFYHECSELLGDHSICYPVVSACTCTSSKVFSYLNIDVMTPCFVFNVQVSAMFFRRI
uniref:Uncharacterized protein n=1 Tax=Cyprinodon variegatus TaxID=28743 RepID=A0A3Q2FXH8_CYPVA